MRITADDKVAFAEYWKFYQPIAAKISEELRESLLRLPECAPIVRAMPPEVMAKQELEGRERQRQAFIEGNWAPYLEDLRKQGIQYAKLGVSFVAWYDIIAIYREHLRSKLVDIARTDVEKASLISDGMNRAIDIERISGCHSGNFSSDSRSSSLICAAIGS